MKLVDIKPYEGFTKGFTDIDNDNKYNLDKCVRIFPHKMHGEGHFVALLKKDNPDDINNAHYTRGSFNTKIPDELKDFLANVSMDIDTKYINIRDNRVYYISRYMADEKGLRIIRNGLLLGELKKNRFEPSQALAMALTMRQYNNCINLSVDDERVTITTVAEILADRGVHLYIHPSHNVPGDTTAHERLDAAIAEYQKKVKIL